MLGMGRRRSQLWWSVSGDLVDGVDVVVKDNLCDDVAAGRKLIDMVITCVLVFEEYVVRLICVYAL